MTIQTIVLIFKYIYFIDNVYIIRKLPQLLKYFSPIHFLIQTLRSLSLHALTISQLLEGSVHIHQVLRSCCNLLKIAAMF